VVLLLLQIQHLIVSNTEEAMSQTSASATFQRAKDWSDTVFDYAEPRSDQRSLQNKIILDHFARHRWLYCVLCLILAVCAYRLSMLSSSLSYLSIPLLIFVFPNFRRPIVSVIQRFTQYFLAFVVVACNAFLVICSFQECFDRDSGERWNAFSSYFHLPTHDVSPRDLLLGVLAFACTLSLTFLFTRPYLSRIRLSFLLLVLGCSAIVLTLPAEVVVSRHASERFLAGLTSSIALMSGIVTVIWSILAILILARRISAQNLAGADLPEGPVDEYIKTSNSIAGTSMVIAFFGVTTCWGYVSGLDRFIDIRAAFARDLIASAILQDTQLQKKLTDIAQSPGNANKGSDPVHDDGWDAQNQEHTLLKSDPPRVDTLPKPIWLEKVTVDSIEETETPIFEHYSEGITFGVTVKEADRPNAWKSQATLFFPIDSPPHNTLALGASCLNGVDDAISYAKIYRTCESGVIDRGAKFPFIDIDFPIQYIILATFISIAGCIIIIADRIRAILKMSLGSRTEPWIVLDAFSMNGKLIGAVWVLGLAATPWLLIALAVGITALQIRLDGSVSTVLHDSLLASTLLSGTIVSALLSTSLIGALMTLRFRITTHSVSGTAPNSLVGSSAD
jgi:hypothetical protein